MSVKVMAAVWDTPTLRRPSVTLVMLALADFASHDGSRIFPSVETLAGMTRLGSRHVKRLLRRLEAEGLVELVHEATSRRPREYRIKLEALGDHSRGAPQVTP